VRSAISKRTLATVSPYCKLLHLKPAVRQHRASALKTDRLPQSAHIANCCTFKPAVRQYLNPASPYLLFLFPVRTGPVSHELGVQRALPASGAHTC
jgi:hypothetical protein